MAEETLTLEVDWDNDGTFGHGSADISADILEIPIQVLGRDGLSQLNARSSAGSLVVILRNDDNKYSRNVSGSPIFGKILPNRRVRLKSETNGGAATVQWHGYLDDIVATARRGGAHTARLEAFGPLAKTAARKAYVSPTTSVLTGAAFDNVLDAIGFPAADRDIDTGKTTMARHFVPGLTGAFALHQIEETEGGFLRETRDAGIAFEDRHHRLTSPHDTVQATFDESVGSDIYYQWLEPTSPMKDIANIIRAKVNLQTVGSLG